MANPGLQSAVIFGTGYGLCLLFVLMLAFWWKYGGGRQLFASRSNISISLSDIPSKLENGEGQDGVEIEMTTPKSSPTDARDPGVSSDASP
jgi:hypothetical protein